MKKLNNKGFSLVELIIVIAIMVILVAVLSPVFSKYVERGRKSTDIQTASELATAIQTELVDPFSTWTAPTGQTELTDANISAIEALSSYSVAPKVKAKCAGDGNTNEHFSFKVDGDKITIYAGPDTGAKEIFPSTDADYLAK